MQSRSHVEAGSGKVKAVLQPLVCFREAYTDTSILLASAADRIMLGGMPGSPEAQPPSKLQLGGSHSDATLQRSPSVQVLSQCVARVMLNENGTLRGQPCRRNPALPLACSAANMLLAAVLMQICQMCCLLLC